MTSCYSARSRPTALIARKTTTLTCVFVAAAALFSLHVLSGSPSHFPTVLRAKNVARIDLWSGDFRAIETPVVISNPVSADALRLAASAGFVSPVTSLRPLPDITPKIRAWVGREHCYREVNGEDGNVNPAHWNADTSDSYRVRVPKRQEMYEFAGKVGHSGVVMKVLEELVNGTAADEKTEYSSKGNDAYSGGQRRGERTTRASFPRRSFYVSHDVAQLERAQLDAGDALVASVWGDGSPPPIHRSVRYGDAMSYATHWDPHSSVVVQLLGEKEYWLLHPSCRWVNAETRRHRWDWRQACAQRRSFLRTFAWGSIPKLGLIPRRAPPVVDDAPVRGLRRVPCAHRPFRTILRPGSLLVIPAGWYHSFETEGRWISYVQR